LTAAYGTTAAVTLTPSDGATTQDVSASISGLLPGQVYHYRLTATNVGGTVTGSDMTFRTLAVPISAAELVAPGVGIHNGSANFTIQASVLGRGYQLQYSDTMASGTWRDIGAVWIGTGANLVITTPYDPVVPRRFYRLALQEQAP
jgi:hypothetical protein